MTPDNQLPRLPIYHSCLRIALLTALLGVTAHLAPVRADGPRPPARIDPICAAVADAANAGGLSAMLVRGGTLSEEDAGRIFPDMPGPLEAYYEADLNGDGDPEQIGLFASRYVDGGIAIVSARSRIHANVEVLQREESDAALTVIRAGNQTFLLRGEPPDALYELGQDSHLRRRCEFRRDDLPAPLTVVKDPAVCAAYQTDSLPRVAFDRMHVLGPLDQNRYPATHPAEGLTQVDIDNDGVMDNVIRLQYGGTRGPLCGDFFAVTDATRNHLPESSLNGLLQQMPCTAEPHLFTTAGRTYIGIQETDTKWSLLTLLKGAWHPVCIREARARIRALSPREEVEMRAEGENPWEYALGKSPDPRADILALVEGGRDVNEHFQDWSPLGRAVFAQREDLVELLLAHGARSEPSGTLRDALAEAVRHNAPRLVSLLIKHGALASDATLSRAVCDKEQIDILDMFGQGGLLAAGTVKVLTPQQVDRERLPRPTGGDQFFITVSPEPGTFRVGGDPAKHGPGTTYALVKEKISLVEQARLCGNLDAIPIIERYHKP